MPQKKAPNVSSEGFQYKGCAELLSHTSRCSTIAAGELDFGVRNGIRYFLTAISTAKSLNLFYDPFLPGLHRTVKVYFSLILAFCIHSICFIRSDFFSVFKVLFKWKKTKHEERLVVVSSTPRSAYTSTLSNLSSSSAL